MGLFYFGIIMSTSLIHLMVNLLKTVYHPAYVSLIEKLILERKNQSVTQMQLANKLGKQQSYVAKVEGCERKLDVLELVEWCNALNQKASAYVRELECEFFGS